jgi:cullin-associated NEDD8-dissociated protein 1
MVDRQSTLHNLNGLLSKLDDPDPDIRYMSLEDLLGVLNNYTSAFLLQDIHNSTKLADALLKALYDQHGEVQNQALKWSVTRIERVVLQRHFTFAKLTLIFTLCTIV